MRNIYHYAANFFAILVCMTGNKSPDFQLSIDVNRITTIIWTVLLFFKIRYVIMKNPAI